MEINIKRRAIHNPFLKKLLVEAFIKGLEMQLSYEQLSYHVHSPGFNPQLKKERKIILQYPKQRVRVSYNSI